MLDRFLNTPPNNFFSELLESKLFSPCLFHPSGKEETTFWILDNMNYFKDDIFRKWCLSEAVTSCYWNCNRVLIFFLRLSVCVCLYSSTCWFLPAARHLRHTWEVRINDLFCCEYFWVLLPSSFISISESILFHLQRRTLQPTAYWRENDLIQCWKDDIYWYRK